MTSSKDILEYERDDFKESTKALKKQDVDWLLNRLVKQYPDLEGYEKDSDKEYLLLNRANLILYSINKNKPGNMRIYVERQLKKKEYDEKLKLLNARINPSLLGKDKVCDELSQEITTLLDGAEREFPGFKKARGMMVSEMFQKIMAYRTEGAVGHIGILKSIRDKTAEESQKAERQPKKMKKKATTR